MGGSGEKLGGGRWASILLSKMTIGGVVKKGTGIPRGFSVLGAHVRIATTVVMERTADKGEGGGKVRWCFCREITTWS